MTNLWTADRRIYLDAHGKAVEAKDPTRVSLLVAVGNTIPLTQAMALGLVATEPAVTPEPIEETPATSDEPDETDEHPEVKPKASPQNKAEKPGKNK